jgi:hypothetical protein
MVNYSSLLLYLYTYNNMHSVHVIIIIIMKLEILFVGSKILRNVAKVS